MSCENLLMDLYPIIPSRYHKGIEDPLCHDMWSRGGYVKLRFMGTRYVETIYINYDAPAGYRASDYERSIVSAIKNIGERVRPVIAALDKLTGWVEPPKPARKFLWGD